MNLKIIELHLFAIIYLIQKIINVQITTSCNPNLLYDDISYTCLSCGTNRELNYASKNTFLFII